MRALVPLLPLVLILGCAGATDDDGSNENGFGVITFVVDGETYEETKAVSTGVPQPGFLGISWNSTGDGDLGDGFYGSLTLSAYTGAASYAPVKRYTDVDAIVTVTTDGTKATYFPQGADGSGSVGDGSIEVTSADEVGAKGTFSFTGTAFEDPTDIQPITGTFDVTFGVATDGDE